MAKDAAVFDRLEEALRDVYSVCEIPSAKQQPEALSHAVSVLLERSSEAIGLQIISLSRVIENAERPQWLKHFYSLRDPGKNTWKSLGALENYSGDDRAKMLGAIQQCVMEWLKHLPDLRNPPAVSRLCDGLHQLSTTFSRLCHLASERQGKRHKTSELQDTQYLELWLKEFWEDMDLAVEGLNDLDEAAIQRMRFLTNNDHWELALRHSLNTASNWLLHTRLNSPTGGTTYNTTAFHRIAQGEIPDWLPLLKELNRQTALLKDIEQADRARIKPNRYPAMLEQHRAAKQHEADPEQDEGAKTASVKTKSTPDKQDRTNLPVKDIVLSDRPNNFLRAMKQLGAIGKQTLASVSAIAKLMPPPKHGGVVDENSLKDVPPLLKRHGLIGTFKNGNAGGAYLTPRGLRYLEILEKQQSKKTLQKKP